MEFVLEIICEEMPTSHLQEAIFQLKTKFTEELKKANLGLSTLKVFATCRRLVVVGDVAPFQEDREETILGPPKSVAFLQDGRLSPAAEGFAKAKGISADSLEIIKTEKGEYLGFKKVAKGKRAQEILAELIPKIILSLSFPKMMRWGEISFKFSRPLRNIFCILGREHLSFSCEGLSSSDSTYGHKIHSFQRLKPKSCEEYISLLKENKVVIDPEERRKIILEQVEKVLSRLEARLYHDEDLLNKIVFDVEMPFVFMGEFPEKYLSLPLEVLSVAMREGQSLFSVVKGKRQLPYFVGVADAPDDPKGLIRKGNERVLKARLEDAKFFWENDLKVSLKERAKSLDSIIYEERLGTYKDKVERLKKLVYYLADQLEARELKQELLEATELAKADLLTEMVREFPLLQGKIGGLYAAAQGYSAQVWKAIYEHYQPLGSEDKIPSSLAGVILSLADKVDTIVGATGIGVKVTGSKDPFGLRRSAHGVCRMAIEKKLRFSLPKVIERAIRLYGEKLLQPKDEVKNSCLEFFSNRLYHLLENNGFRYDLIKASLAIGLESIYDSYLRIQALDNLRKSQQFTTFIHVAKRVTNILRDHPLYKLNPDLLIEKEEKELYTCFNIIKENVNRMLLSGDFAKAQRMIFNLSPSIDKFFDGVLVMAEDRKIRRNRLALLQSIQSLFFKIADYSQIVPEG